MKKITYYIYKQEKTDVLLETISKYKADKFFNSLPTGHTMWQVIELNEKLVATNIIKTK